MNIRKLQIENLRLDNEKLQKEIHKLEVETDVLQVKKKYYKIKLQTIQKEHPGVVAKMEEENESWNIYFPLKNNYVHRIIKDDKHLYTVYTNLEKRLFFNR